MANFEDTGQYYSNIDMMARNIVLSMNTGLVYDIEDAQNVKIIKKVSDEFFAIAKKDIEGDGSCFSGDASTYTDINDKLCWEF
jgi:hypothetical protein